MSQIKGRVIALIQGVIATFGRVNMLVNNAGLMALAPLAKTLVDEWEQMVDIDEILWRPAQEL